MASVHGYHGKYLSVDLSTGTGQSLPLEETLLRRTLGGSGLGTALLLAAGAAEADPLSPASSIVFTFSPLVGSPLTTSAKFAVVSKSPLTGRINDSLASSGFAIAGKKTGHDALLFTGRAAEPSIVLIDEGQVRLVSTKADGHADLWGTDIPDTERQLQLRYPDYQFAVIGPAGEQQVHYATISHDGRHAGRGGSGAVLGAKNIKAIGVRGNQRCDWAQPEQLVAFAKDLSAKSFGPATAKYRELGTASNLLTFNRLNVLPTRNFQQGSFAAAEQISPEQLGATRERTRASCAACTIGCEHLYSFDNDQDNESKQPVRLEYENLFALGPLCEVGDGDTVLRASQRCDQLGLDTISAGGTIAFAMECQERGLLANVDAKPNTKDTLPPGGSDAVAAGEGTKDQNHSPPKHKTLDSPWLKFGDGSSLLRALEEIHQQTPLGKMLARGSRAMADWVGQGSLDFAPQVKGLELPGYDPRGLQTMALGFAVGTRGADHNRSGAYEADFSESVDRRQLNHESAARAIATEDKAAIMDSLILCKFLRGVFDDFYAAAAEMLTLVTGWDVTAAELRDKAAQIVTVKKQFNIAAGWTPAEDTLPPRMLGQALTDDPQAVLSAEQLATAVQAYNKARGWTADGWLK